MKTFSNTESPSLEKTIMVQNLSYSCTVSLRVFNGVCSAASHENADHHKKKANATYLFMNSGFI